MALWDNLRSLEEEFMLNQSEHTAKLISKLKKEVEARKRFEQFINIVASDGIAAMEELNELNKGE